MSATEEMTSYGRRYLQTDSYGAAAFCFHRALLQNSRDENAWNGLILALSLMRMEADIRIALARYALLDGLGFDRDLLPAAMLLWRDNPVALAEWTKAMSARAKGPEKEALEGMSADLDRAVEALKEKRGEQWNQGMPNLAQTAAQKLDLDWIAEQPRDKLLAQLEQGIVSEDLDTSMHAIRMLCMMPDPKSEALLRRACRNEELDPKAVTHAALSLRWLGVRGNVKLVKMGEPVVINLENPTPELTISVPAAFKPALDRMKLWLAMKAGIVTAEEYESFASTDEPQLPEELAEKLKRLDIPAAFEEVVHVLIRAAYDHYYPFVPKPRGLRDWSDAMLQLMKEYAEGIGMEWTFGEPDTGEISVGHKRWILSASPDFQDNVRQIRETRARMNL
ncbi:HEAT repeat domain-containing protein [Paenibacillus thermoaerophilus]|uniref:HEAT repeat domain-containing protein n=1 Tax=Paenibacillus thermoaerophilus TaxID=1215385 RepID=A0ABW2V0T0_9BACL|nr:HEAT repeat domain-containing protein [Paenibacillus thermoaerophilus]TMV18990.1 HEAT repeat domain-containing protein [Paenibacillus thermoaerophilus]